MGVRRSWRAGAVCKTVAFGLKGFDSLGSHEIEYSKIDKRAGRCGLSNFQLILALREFPRQLICLLELFGN